MSENIKKWHERMPKSVNISAIVDTVQAMKAEIDELRAALSAKPVAQPAITASEDEHSFLSWAYDALYEVNIDNYDHDGVCKLNDSSVEVILAIKARLSTIAATSAPLANLPEPNIEYPEDD